MKLTLLTLLALALYVAIGIALGAAGLGLYQWQFWVVLLSVILIDVLSYVSGFQKGVK